MCLKDLLESLHEMGVPVTTSQVRWAINSGKVARPPLDGSLRFVFTSEHVDRIAKLYRDGKFRSAARRSSRASLGRLGVTPDSAAPSQPLSVDHVCHA